MLIFSQDKKTIINIDEVSRIFVSEQGNAIIQTEEEFLGKYSSENRAIEIMEEIMKVYSLSWPTYHMPKNKEEHNAR